MVGLIPLLLAVPLMAQLPPQEGSPVPVTAPPLTLADLEAILRQPDLLPPGCSARPIGTYDFAWNQPDLDKEMRIICNASYYEDNSDSCELWVPGSPLFPLALCVVSKDETQQPSMAEFQQTIAGI